jgi:hypothetical protein
MAKNAARNIQVSQGSSSFNSNVFGQYCYQNGSFNTASSGFNLNAVIPYINVPVGIAFNGSNTNEYMTAWCSQNSAVYGSSQQNYNLNSAIDASYYGGVNGCIAAVTSGSYIQPKFTGDLSTMTISFHVGNTALAHLGIVTSRAGVSCRDSKNNLVSGQIGNGTLSSNFGEYDLQCTRTGEPVASHPGQLAFPDVTLTISGFPSGLIVYWPKDQRLAPDDAQLIMNSLTGLTGEIGGLQKKNAQLQDQLNLAGSLVGSNQFIVANSAGCPAHYNLVAVMLWAHNYRDPNSPVQDDSNDPMHKAGFTVNNFLWLANPGWGLVHPLICQLDQATKAQLVVP